MTMRYELKCRHEVCFKAKIGLTGLIVNSNAKNLNCKTTESKKLLTSLAKSVVHVVDRSLHCTVHTDHLNYNYRGPLQAHAVNMHSTYRIWCF